MTFDTWLLYLLAIILIAVSPGTIAVVSMRHGIHYGKRRSVSTALGSVAAALILMTLSATGLGVILSTTEHGFTILKYCGAAYLFFLGATLLLTRADGKNLALQRPEGHGTPPQMFKQAFLVGLSNPKDLLFFGALFPQFIDLSAPQGMQLVILATTWAVVDFSCVMMYACMAHTLAAKLTTSNKLHWFDRTSGGVFITLSAMLVAREN